MPTVEIYTKTLCAYCWRAKMLLESKGIAYQEIGVDFGGEQRETDDRTRRRAHEPCRRFSSASIMSAAATI